MPRDHNILLEIKSPNHHGIFEQILGHILIKCSSIYTGCQKMIF